MSPLRTSLGLVLGLAITPALAACPYASKRGIDPDNVPDNHVHHANAPRDSPVCEGQKGTFYMNRIAPGTSELYIADADGINERPYYPILSSSTMRLSPQMENG